MYKIAHENVIRKESNYVKNIRIHKEKNNIHKEKTNIHNEN